MSDLCRQCTKEIWGEDSSDFDIYPSDDHNKFDFDGGEQIQNSKVLCEGCGYILVNRYGSCVDPDCQIHGDHNNVIEKKFQEWQKEKPDAIRSTE